MTDAEIIKAVEKLKSEYGICSPEKLCEYTGIPLLFHSMGNHPGAIKGFVIGVDGVYTVVVNSDIDDNIQKTVTAHELCHALYHGSNNIQRFDESTLFDEASVHEKEANLFAAELLISDDDVFEALDEGETFFGAASKLCVPVQLLDFKFRLMKKRGVSLPDVSVESRNNFLGKI